MCPPCALACVFHHDPVTLADGLAAGAGGEDFGAAFVAGDGGGLRGAEYGGEGGFAGVDALDLVDVGGVNGCGEEAEG